jgi:hypothetical protein
MQALRASAFFILAVAVSVPQARGASNNSKDPTPQLDFCNGLLASCNSACEAAAIGSLQGAVGQGDCNQKCQGAYHACMQGHTYAPAPKSGPIKSLPPTTVSPPQKPPRKGPGQVKPPTTVKPPRTPPKKTGPGRAAPPTSVGHPDPSPPPQLRSRRNH